MSRPRRHSPGGMVFPVLNRGVGRRVLFTKDEDFLAFERVVEETLRARRMRLCAYCLMPNHWHFVVWPERDGDLPAFMQQVTNKHVKRWKEHRHEIGYGHLYQGRYKCFPVETEDYFSQVVRYVERNALRENLVERAESWRWSSLRRVEREDPAFPILSTWPLPRPTDCMNLVDADLGDLDHHARKPASCSDSRRDRLPNWQPTRIFRVRPATPGKLENNYIIDVLSYLHICGSGKEVK